MALDKLTQVTTSGITSTSPLSSLTISGAITGGDATFDSVDVNGVLTYDDVTNIDALGIVTARSGVHFGTAASGKLVIGNSNGIGIGTDNPTELLHLSADSAHEILLKRGGGVPSEVKFSNRGNLAVISNNTNGISFETGSTPSEAMRIESSGNVGIGTDNPSVNLHVKGSASNGQIYLGGTGAHSQIYADNDGVLILNADQGDSAANSYLGFNVDNTERLRITSDGSTYTGGSTITESDMNWGHDTYQRPHIFTGATGGNPSDGAIVVASPETDPSATRVGTVIFGCKTSSSTGVSNSGLKAAIDSNTNTNVSDAWKTGGDLRFRTRPDNGNLTERMRIHSNGCITKPNNPLLKVNSTTSYGAFQSLHISPNASIAQATAQANIGDTGWTTSGANAYTFVCPVTGVYALHAHISLSNITQGNRVIWSMAYTLGGGNLPLANYVEVIDTNVFDYQNASYFDTWYFTAGTRVGMGINSSTGGAIAGLALSWGMYLLQ